MTDRQLMQQALDALTGVLDDDPKVLMASISGGLYEVVQCRDVITALRERLAHCDRCGETCERAKMCATCAGVLTEGEKHMTKEEAMKLALQWAEAHGEIVFAGGGMDAVNKMNSWVKALAQPEQEPVVFCMHWVDRWGCNHYADPKEPHPVNAKPLYTAPPQRKPLSDEEIDDLSRTMVKGSKSANWLCRAIEAAHGIKEKNNGN